MFAVILLLLATCIPSQVLATSFPKVIEYRLPNGMKFLLVPRGEAPIFSATVRFRVGGMDEEKGKSGAAHFVEHMAFKGTKEIEPLELVRRVEEAGGDGYNATTSRDFTTYMVNFPSSQLRFWAEIESKRIFNPFFRDFESEKQVILEERRMRVDDNPAGRLDEELIKLAFAGSPYEWPVIGSPEDLRQLSLSDLEKFWKLHYRPENAVGVLVGRFDPAEAKKILLKTFGQIPKGSGKVAATFSETPLEKEVRFQIHHPARKRLAIGYPKPTLPHRDDYLLDLVATILGGGESSRLHRRLVKEEKLVSEIGITTSFPGVRGPNLFLIDLTPLEKAAVGEILKKVDEEVGRFKKEGPTEREMNKAVNMIQADLIWEMKTNEGLASRLSFYELAAGSWRYLENYPEVISQITREEVMDAAQRYLGEVRIIGEIGK